MLCKYHSKRKIENNIVNKVIFKIKITPTQCFALYMVLPILNSVFEEDL